MWEIKRSPLNSAKLLVYSIDNEDIIFIPLFEDGHGYGAVYLKDSWASHRALKITTKNSDGTEANYVSVDDRDLEVLKIKCLVKAKELNYNIKEVLV